MSRFITPVILFFALLVSGGLMAQEYSIEPSKEIFVSKPASDLFGAEIKFKNLKTDELVLSWELLENNFPTGWDYSLCDYDRCHPGVPASNTMTALPSGTQGYLKLTIIPNNVAASVTMKFLVYVEGTPKNQGDTIVFNITTTTTGISKNFSYATLAYPNPVKERLFLNFENPSSRKIEIFNAKGQSVQLLENISLNHLSVETSGLGAGIYFLRVTGENGIEELSGKFLKID